MRGRPKTFVWREMARSGEKPIAKVASKHGEDYRYTRYGCRCDACRLAHRNAIREQRKRASQAELRARGAIVLWKRVPVSEFGTLSTDNPVLHWRLKRFARERGITMTQALDHIVNLCLDRETEPMRRAA